MRTIEVLVAVEPRPLLRVIEHLLQNATTFRFTARSAKPADLLRQTGRLRPNLILVNARFLGPGACHIFAELKRVSPNSKLIVVTDFLEGASQETRSPAADAYLEEEKLVRRLVPIAQRLARHGKAYRARKPGGALAKFPSDSPRVY